MLQRRALDVGLKAVVFDELLDDLAVFFVEEVVVLPPDGHLDALVLAFKHQHRAAAFADLDAVFDDDPLEDRLVDRGITGLDLDLFSGDKIVFVAEFEILLRGIAVAKNELRRRDPIDRLRRDDRQQLVARRQFFAFDEHRSGDDAHVPFDRYDPFVAHEEDLSTGGKTRSVPTAMRLKLVKPLTRATPRYKAGSP